MGSRSIGRLISILNRQAQMYLNNALKDLDIGSSEHIFLINLLHVDGITQEDLSARVLIDKGATARALKSLEEKGYVRREADAQDKRSKRVFVTAKAADRGAEIHQALERWTTYLTEDLEPEAVSAAMDILEKMADKARGSGCRKKGKKD